MSPADLPKGNPNHTRFHQRQRAQSEPTATQTTRHPPHTATSPSRLHRHTQLRGTNHLATQRLPRTFFQAEQPSQRLTAQAHLQGARQALKNTLLAKRQEKPQIQPPYQEQFSYQHLVRTNNRYRIWRDLQNEIVLERSVLERRRLEVIAEDSTIPVLRRRQNSADYFY